PHRVRHLFGAEFRDLVHAPQAFDCTRRSSTSPLTCKSAPCSASAASRRSNRALSSARAWVGSEDNATRTSCLLPWGGGATGGLCGALTAPGPTDPSKRCPASASWLRRAPRLTWISS